MCVSTTAGALTSLRFLHPLLSLENFYDSTWGTFIALTESLDEVPEEFMQEDDIGTLPAGGQITFARRARNSKTITAKAGNGANSRRSIAGF